MPLLFTPTIGAALATRDHFLGEKIVYRRVGVEDVDQSAQRPSRLAQSK
jgi:hypothetical protein